MPEQTKLTDNAEKKTKEKITPPVEGQEPPADAAEGTDKETIDHDEEVALTPQERSDSKGKSIVIQEAARQILSDSAEIAGIAGFSEQEAMRMVWFAFCKVEEAMAKSGITWPQVKQKKLKNSLAKVALFGLDAEQNEVYAIPYRDGKAKGKDLWRIDLAPSYLGEKKLRMLYSVVPLKKIDAGVVREGDLFEFKRSSDGDSFIHKPLPFNDGEIKGYYGYIVTKDGETTLKEFPLSKIEEYKEASIKKMGKLGPAWTAWPVEMALAKVIKHISKGIPMKWTEKMQAMYESFEAAEETEVVLIDDKPRIALTEKTTIKPGDM